jgi:undecaprenyl-phosphate 4-deoxy-4-formamido-L-arabinose transferase
MSAKRPRPAVSTVVPVFNEEANLPALFQRLGATLDHLGVDYEMIFVDDGSRDRSLELLREFAATNPRVQVVEFVRNFGQHAAVFAGLERSRGEIVVTLDADLQNPPEEIPKLLAKIAEGYDVVGGWRAERHDSVLRKMPSKLVNLVMSKVTGVKLNDYGCMLRAYRRPVVKSLCQCNEISSFIPALANTFAKNVAEVPVDHAERAAGTSKYGLLKLINLNFDLVTGFSRLPLKMTTFVGMIVAFFSFALAAYIVIMRIVRGESWAQFGTFTLFAVLFFFVGMLFIFIGLMGEYVGRIYSEVRRRPRYVIRKIHRFRPGRESSEGPGVTDEDDRLRLPQHRARMPERASRPR